jgi:hypothetical protein
MGNCGCRIKYSFLSYDRKGVIVTELRPEIDRSECQFNLQIEQPRDLPPTINTSIQLPNVGFLRQHQVLMFNSRQEKHVVARHQRKSLP